MSVKLPDMDAITLEDVKRLRVSEGDVLVISVNENVPASVLEHVAVTLKETFPVTPCMILAAPSFDLGIAESIVENYRAELDAAFDRVAEGRMAERVAAAVAAGSGSMTQEPARGVLQGRFVAAKRAFLDA